ncbi:MAG: DUF2339 domain-containing protein [Chitinophagaceae bacterium]|nr:DUF2339 domain-containing protein [Chitinophagaceae bacterium]MCW5926081.1 DUF2339 domain-containing protein [Chitinophagaceae bacterium]
MEILIFLFLVVILVLIIQQKNSYAKEAQKLQDELRQLKEEVTRLSLPSLQETIIVQQPPPPQPVKQEEVKPELPEAVYEKPLEETLFVIREEEVIEPPVLKKEEPVYTSPPKPKKPGFFERNPDLEKFIGENLISKIGIAILVLAVGFFVKYAIDNEWIGTVGRVAIGIGCGAILIGLAHKLQKNYTAFSSVLVGGGLAVFYFTISLAYHEYRLFPQLTAFIIMVVITSFAVLLSLLYDRQELAIISLIGGFATPFIASSGNGNYISLFIYLIILNSGLLVISYKKAWRLLNLLAFIFTVIIYAGWLLFGYHNDVTVYRNGFIFATIFYLLFLAINIAHNVKENKRFIASDFGILLANTCLYFSAGLYLLTETGLPGYRGIFSASMGIFNMALSYILFRNKKTDNNILYLLIGITLTFVSLTAPIQLKGNNITLFWASEAVLLYWLYRKSGIKLMLLASGMISIAMLLSLVMDWINVYGGDVFTTASLTGKSNIIPIIINKAFITTLYAALSCWVLWALYRRSEKTESGIYAALPAKTFYLIAGILLLYLSGLLEICYQFNSRYPGMGLGTLYGTMYTLAFITVFAFASLWFHLFKAPVYTLAVYATGVLVHLLFVANAYQVQTLIQNGNLASAHFTAHWVSALLFIVIIVQLIRLLSSGATGIKNYGIAAWVISLVSVAFIGMEGSLLSNSLFSGADNPVAYVQRVYIKTGLPILWGLSSFVLMWLGMRNKFRALRIISLVLFGITLLKLFLFDIRNIPVAGKIAAFFSLGVLLLVVSFMYQRLKKIIIEDEKKEP